MRNYSTNLYSKKALLKAANAFTDAWYLHLDCDGKYYVVKLQAKDTLLEIVDEKSYMAFENELIAQQTRLMVANRTKNLREMIVARALSSTMINDFQDEIEEDINSENAMRDWFDEE